MFPGPLRRRLAWWLSSAASRLVGSTILLCLAIPAAAPARAPTGAPLSGARASSYEAALTPVSELALGRVHIGMGKVTVARVTSRRVLKYGGCSTLRGRSDVMLFFSRGRLAVFSISKKGAETSHGVRVGDRYRAIRLHYHTHVVRLRRFQQFGPVLAVRSSRGTRYLVFGEYQGRISSIWSIRRGDLSYDEMCF